MLKMVKLNAWDKYVRLLNDLRKVTRKTSLLQRSEYDAKRVKQFRKIKGMKLEQPQFEHGERVLVWNRQGLVGNEYKYNNKWNKNWFYNYRYGNTMVLMDAPIKQNATITNCSTHCTNVRKYHQYDAQIPEIYKQNNCSRYIKWMERAAKQ